MSAPDATGAGPGLCVASSWWAAGGAPPAVATSSAIKPSDTARITHQFGRPRATRERSPSPGSALPPNTGTRYARVTVSARTSGIQTSGTQTALAAVTAGVQGAAVASGQRGQLRHRIPEDVVGVEDLDVVGPHPLVVQVDEQAGQLLEVGFRPRRGMPIQPVRLRRRRIAPRGPSTGRAGAEGDSGWRRAGRGQRTGGPGRTIPAARARSSRGAHRRTPPRPAIRHRGPSATSRRPRRARG